MLYREDWISSREAAAYVEKYLSIANENWDARLKVFTVTQPVRRICVARQSVEDRATADGVSITVIVLYPDSDDGHRAPFIRDRPDGW